MKKLIILAVILLAFAAGLSAASFDGLTSIGFNYEYRDGVHLGGLSSHTFGYVNDCPVGYLVSVNGDFNLAQDAMVIGMLVGPSFRIDLGNAPLSLDIAVGAALAGQSFTSDNGLFELGVGGYVGLTYYATDAIALLLGCNIGYDMLSVGLSTGETGFSGDFYVSPSVSVGFRY